MFSKSKYEITSGKSQPKAAVIHEELENGVQMVPVKPKSNKHENFVFFLLNQKIIEYHHLVLRP